jgi:hypothetical protein
LKNVLTVGTASRTIVPENVSDVFREDVNMGVLQATVKMGASRSMTRSGSPRSPELLPGNSLINRLGGTA